MVIKGCASAILLQQLGDNWLVLMAQNVPWKHSSSPSHHPNQPELLPQGTLGPKTKRYWCQILLLPSHLCASTEIRIHQTRLRFSSLQLSSCGDSVPTSASAMSSWLSAVGLKVVFSCCSLCCEMFFPDHYKRSRCSHSVNLNQSGHSLSTRRFSLQTCCSLDVFFFIAQFRVNSRDSCV